MQLIYSISHRRFTRTRKSTTFACKTSIRFWDLYKRVPDDALPIERWSNGGSKAVVIVVVVVVIYTDCSGEIAN